MGGFAFAQYYEDPWDWPGGNTSDKWSIYLEAGPKLGAGLSHASQPDLFDVRLKSGFTYQAGLSVNAGFVYYDSYGHKLSPKGIGRLGLAVELLLSGRKAKTENGKLSMLCLEIPILLRFFITDGLSLEAGTTLVQPLKVGPETLQMQDLLLNTGELKPSDVMFTLGAGYRLSNLDIGFRCNIGTSSLASNLNSKITTYTLSVGYLFPLIK